MKCRTSWIIELVKRAPTLLRTPSPKVRVWVWVCEVLYYDRGYEIESTSASSRTQTYEKRRGHITLLRPSSITKNHIFFFSSFLWWRKNCVASNSVEKEDRYFGLLLLLLRRFFCGIYFYQSVNCCYQLYLQIALSYQWKRTDKKRFISSAIYMLKAIVCLFVRKLFSNLPWRYLHYTLQYRQYTKGSIFSMCQELL